MHWQPAVFTVLINWLLGRFVSRQKASQSIITLVLYFFNFVLFFNLVLFCFNLVLLLNLVLKSALARHTMNDPFSKEQFQ